jgi:hypothetical protein
MRTTKKVYSYPYPFEVVVLARLRRYPVHPDLPLIVASSVVSRALAQDDGTWLPAPLDPDDTPAPPKCEAGAPSARTAGAGTAVGGGALHAGGDGVDDGVDDGVTADDDDPPGEQVTRRRTARLDIPEWVKRAVGVREVDFDEVTELDRFHRRLTLRSVNRTLRDKMHLSETVVIEPCPENKGWTRYEQVAALSLSRFPLSGACEKFVLRAFEQRGSDGRKVDLDLIAFEIADLARRHHNGDATRIRAATLPLRIVTSAEIHGGPQSSLAPGGGESGSSIGGGAQGAAASVADSAADATAGAGNLLSRLGGIMGLGAAPERRPARPRSRKKKPDAAGGGGGNGGAAAAGSAGAAAALGSAASGGPLSATDGGGSTTMPATSSSPCSSRASSMIDDGSGSASSGPESPRVGSRHRGSRAYPSPPPHGAAAGAGRAQRASLAAALVSTRGLLSLGIAGAVAALSFTTLLSGMVRVVITSLTVIACLAIGSGVVGGGDDDGRSEYVCCNFFFFFFSRTFFFFFFF